MWSAFGSRRSLSVCQEKVAKDRNFRLCSSSWTKHTITTLKPPLAQSFFGATHSSHLLLNSVTCSSSYRFPFTHIHTFSLKHNKLLAMLYLLFFFSISCIFLWIDKRYEISSQQEERNQLKSCSMYKASETRRIKNRLNRCKREFCRIVKTLFESGGGTRKTKQQQERANEGLVINYFTCKALVQEMNNLSSSNKSHLNRPVVATEVFCELKP